MFEKVKTFLANLFKIDTTIYSDKPKILKEVDILDSVWVKDSEDVIWSGWVYAKEKDRIIVTYSDLGEQLKDIVVLTKDEYATKVSKNNIIIYFNDPRKNIL